jgi:uncharacterized protein
MALTGETIHPGRAEAPLLPLTAPLSFWGGVDRRTGAVLAAGHPQQGALLAGRAVVIESLIGSSSSAAVLLELIAIGRAPAALLLGGIDAILVMGCLAAREIGHVPPPILRIARGLEWPEGRPISIEAVAAGEEARMTLR